ncbi:MULTISPECIES: glycoside hydrolase family 13 protein [Lactococcus]|uniref:Glycoside hydrolase family 13 protein n=2 Tax=Bacteria TaxID=2 RepID=A0AAJ2ISA7_9LACT|nr:MULTISPECIES: glycoside hydrolase family 13 protein [Lactococcus]PST73751.1 alpha-glycosidase [Lactococcus garvieae]MCG3096171.1 glycoside hydrolase family 13 protein [Lactococcus petauri]MCR8688068.1 glycoside hydrolase family 13 protein [Lactococcus petauri]MDC0809246.1 glycoside hydrolase family 13 protein [Lactococcus petauri]MDC0813099.1 glycoside hydrolase family 13 protein [Lactococcus petauri]
MNKAAIYHRPESEFAYLYTEETIHIRLRVARDDIQSVALIYGDPYMFVKRDDESEMVWDYQEVEMKHGLSTAESDFYVTEVGVPHKRMDYLFVITDYDGEKVVYSDSGILPYQVKLLTKKYAAFRMPFFHEVDRFKAPEWVKNTVWYQIFPERFANGNPAINPVGVKEWDPTESPNRQDLYGGDLQGVIDHLDHLTDLGVNGIYFTPVFQAYSNHKYDTEDYLKIDQYFGDLEVFKTLVKEAHQRGIKVMLDAVFNHIGDTSPQWQDVLKHQENSKYADWFHVNQWPATYTPTEDFEVSEAATYDTFAFTPHMPKLNTANPEVQEYLLNIAEYWIKECDIDAWRLDVADEVDHAFWKKFRTTCDAAKDDFYILGEVWHSAQPWLVGDEFSAVMNYAYTNAIIDTFVKEELSLEQMVSAINAQLMLYRKQTNQVMFNILDSHDTPRLLTQAKGSKDLVKQVQAFMYLQPGVPCIYYGDEYGLDGGADPDCRKCMPWTEEHQDLEMFAFFKDLVAFRREYAETLSQTDLDWQCVDDTQGVVKLERGALKAVFNKGEQPVSVEEGEIVLAHLAEDNYVQKNGFIIYK